MSWDYISAPQFAAAERRAELLRLHVHSRKLENVPYDFDLADSKRDRSWGEHAACPIQSVLRMAATTIWYRSHRFATTCATMFVFKGYVEAGGLMSYGVDNVAMFRQGANFQSPRFSRVRSPTIFPVELPTKYETVLNLKTAKAIGVELPTSILIRADQVIE